MLIAFVREAESDLGQYDMWRMAFIHWPSIPWKRSALAYLPGLLAKVSQAWEYVSVLLALDRCGMQGRCTRRVCTCWLDILLCTNMRGSASRMARLVHT